MTRATRYYAKRNRKMVQTSFLDLKEEREERQARLAMEREERRLERQRLKSFGKRWRSHQKTRNYFLDHFEEYGWEEIYIFLKCGRKFPFKDLAEAEWYRLGLPQSRKSSSFICPYNPEHAHHGRDGSKEISLMLRPLFDVLVNWRQRKIPLVS